MSYADGPPQQRAYQQALDRIRAEYLEMPDMRLTASQVQRLSGVDVAIGQQVLDDLVLAGFLRLNADGTYARRTDDAPTGSGRAAAGAAPDGPTRTRRRVN